MLFLLGIFCNVLFQAYTALRAAVSPGRLMAHALDGLVSVFVLAVIACVVFIVNYGELRLYILISLAMGFILSNALVGNLIYSIAFYCVNAVMEAVSQIKHAAIAYRQHCKPKGAGAADKQPEKATSSRQWREQT